MTAPIQPMQQQRRYRTIRPSGVGAVPQMPGMQMPPDPMQAAPKPPSDSPSMTPVPKPPATSPAGGLPVQTPTMTPVPHNGGVINEGPEFAPPIDPGAPTMDNNLRGSTFTPGGDPRLTAAQSATDKLFGAVTGGQSYSTMAGANADRYRSIYGNGQVGFSPVQTDARYRAINTNAPFRSINTNVAAGPSVDPMETDRVARYGSAQDDALDSLNGPSRTELAKQKLKDFDAVSDEQRFKEERSLGQNLSKFGRSGMGANADAFGEITRKIAGDRGRLENELAASVAEGDINDRFRRIDATSGLRGQEEGIASGRRGESRTERDYTTGLGERNVARGTAERDAELGATERGIGRQQDERDLESAIESANIGRRVNERDAGLGVSERNQDRAFDRTNATLDAAGRDASQDIQGQYDRLNAGTTLEDKIFNQGGSNRAEMRSERGYQQDAAQQSLDNRIRERGIQAQEKKDRLARAVALMDQGDGISLEEALRLTGGA